MVDRLDPVREGEAHEVRDRGVLRFVHRLDGNGVRAAIEPAGETSHVERSHGRLRGLGARPLLFIEE
ncbi:MAG: hypothetical protein HC923_09765 [Myxococcales bacterium]|nr:hypothetical protein [Myxococcales bacterium]